MVLMLRVSTAVPPMSAMKQMQERAKKQQNIW